MLFFFFFCAIAYLWDYRFNILGLSDNYLQVAVFPTSYFTKTLCQWSSVLPPISTDRAQCFLPPHAHFHYIFVANQKINSVYLCSANLQHVIWGHFTKINPIIHTFQKRLSLTFIQEWIKCVIKHAHWWCKEKWQWAWHRATRGEVKHTIASPRPASKYLNEQNQQFWPEKC